MTMLTIPSGPYSQFRVGCTILLKSSAASTTAWKDRLIKGANVENASYPVGTCAERVALGTAVVQGVKYGDIKAIAVATDIKEFCSPCGMCRQFMREFCEQEMPVVMHNCDGETKTMTMAEVLPSSTPSILPANQSVAPSLELWPECPPKSR